MSEATLWVVDLAAGPHDDSLLHEDERARARRFVFDVDRARYIAGRSALRVLLGRELGVHPARVSLESTAHGRPFCAALAGRLDFNLSHSGDVAVIALAAQPQVGVDVELLRAVPDALDLSRHYFSASESRQLAELDETQRDRAFLTCWTRKEAVLKATGLGLSIAPAGVVTGIDDSAVTVTLREGRFAVHTQPLVVNGEQAIVSLALPRAVERITLRDFEPTPTALRA